MDTRKFEELIRLSEGNTIDFKSDQYDFSGENKTEKSRKRANFIKDIISFYNTPRDEESYIVLGVKKYPDGKYDLVGIDKHLDDAEYQSKFESFVHPHPTFQYWPFEYKGKSYGVIIIPPDRSIGPCVPLIDIGNIIHKHQIYVRKGSMNATADVYMQKKVFKWFSESNPAEQLEDTGNREWNSVLNRKKMGTGKLFEKFEEKQNIKPDKSIKVNPDDWAFLFREGENLAALGRHDEADKAFEKASEINPDAWAVWYQWGKTLGVLGRYDKALEANEKAKELKQKQDHPEKTSREALTKKGREKESE